MKTEVVIQIFAMVAALSALPLAWFVAEGRTITRLPIAIAVYLGICGALLAEAKWLFGL